MLIRDERVCYLIRKEVPRDRRVKESVDAEHVLYSFYIAYLFTHVISVFLAYTAVRDYHMRAADPKVVRQLVVGLHRLSRVFLGLVKMSLAQLRHCKVVQDRCVSGISFKAFPEIRLRLTILLVAVIEHSHREVRLQIPGIRQKHLTREHRRHVEVGTLHRQTQPLAWRETRASLSDHLQLPAYARERLVALVQVVRELAFGKRAFLVTVSIQPVCPQTAHPRHSPLHPREQVA